MRMGGENSALICETERGSEREREEVNFSLCSELYQWTRSLAEIAVASHL